MFMKRSLRSIGVAALAVIAIAGCQPAPQGPTGLTEADVAAIRAGSQAWVTAANARDHEGIANLYTEDGMLMPTNFATVQGRAAIQEFFTNFPPFENFQAQQTEIEGMGDMAHAVGTYSMTLNLPFAPAPIQDHGKFIEIWKKQADGSWKISRDIYNSDLGAGGGE